MAEKTRSAAPAEAQQVFRQFAWNIAGTLAGAKSEKPMARGPRKPAVRRKEAGK